jgi:hypothetical protein
MGMYLVIMVVEVEGRRRVVSRSLQRGRYVDLLERERGKS